MEKTPKLFYKKLPKDIPECFTILVDPMLATGRSLVSVYEALQKYGKPKDIHIVSVIDEARRQRGKAARGVVVAVLELLLRGGWLMAVCVDGGGGVGPACVLARAHAANVRRERAPHRRCARVRGWS